MIARREERVVLPRRLKMRTLYLKRNRIIGYRLATHHIFDVKINLVNGE